MHDKTRICEGQNAPIFFIRTYPETLQYLFSLGIIVHWDFHHIAESLLHFLETQQKNI
jgi:hypothetical protein